MDISKFLRGRKLDASTGKPLYLQMALLIAEKIRDQSLPAKSKLPPERELAKFFNVSRTTAINAYRYLEKEGLIKTKVGSGTYVTESIAASSAASPGVPWPQLFATYPATSLSSILRELVSAPAADIVSLAVGMPDPALYPLTTFTKLFNKHEKKLSQADFGYIPTEGYTPLRHSVAEMLCKKGISVTEDNVMILSGAQQGIYLLSKVLLEPGDYVVTESPTFIGAIQAFQTAGARILSLPVSGNLPLSLLEDYLIRYRPKMLYLMPTFQNPSGRLLSLQDRQSLLQLAARHRLAIIEDDPYSDLYYGAEPPPTLKSLDPYGGVVYLGTFSKNLSPGLRTGYIVAPPVLINRLAHKKQYVDLHSSNIAQWLVHMFLEDGYLADHLSLVRKAYKKRRDTMAKALRRFCGDAVDFVLPEGGFYFWCKMSRSGSVRRLLHEAAKKGVSFVPGEAFCTTPAQDKEFRLCFVTHNETILIDGSQRLAKALTLVTKNKTPENDHAFTAAPPIV